MGEKSATIWHNVDHKSARIHGPWVRHEEHLQLLTQARAEGREAGLREACVNEATYPYVQKFLDRHVIQYMVETGSVFGPLDTCWHMKCFANEWITLDMARAVLRSLTDRGCCRYARGLFTEDGHVAGAGYGLTNKGLEYYKELCPPPPTEAGGGE